LLVVQDILALVVQSIGGGIASGTQPVLGGHIALGGIALQLAVIVLYTALAAEFLIRYTLDRPMGRYGETGAILSRGALDTRMRYMLMAMSATVLFLLTRSVYRMIELSGGWDGKVFSTQWLFNVFDGAMIVFAMYTLNIFHPGVLFLGPDKLEADAEEPKV